MKKKRATRYALILVILAVLFAGAWYWTNQTNTKTVTKTNKSNAAAGAQTSSGSSQPSSPGSSTTGGFDNSAHSLTDPTSIWVVVNKTRPLNPKTYAPNLVVPDIPLRSNITSTEKYVSSTMAGPLKTMVDAARTQGVQLNLQSGYRSYNFQVSLYNSYVQQQGQATADSQSARPGYSEHQTGLAADLGGVTQPSCNVGDCFASTTEGKWLAANAYKYGFVIRYPAGKQGVTGYIYEPWHVRYVGTDLSTEMHNQGASTLEEFFGLPAAPDYK